MKSFKIQIFLIEICGYLKKKLKKSEKNHFLISSRLGGGGEKFEVYQKSTKNVISYLFL